jgi:hypothetical protein
VNNPTKAVTDIFPSPFEDEEGIIDESYYDESGSVNVEFIIIDYAKRFEDDYTWNGWDKFLLDADMTRVGLSNKLIESGMTTYTDVVKIGSQIVKIDFKDCYEYAYSGSFWLFPKERRFNFLTVFGEDTFAIVSMACDLDDWNRVEDIWIRIRNSIEID